MSEWKETLIWGLIFFGLVFFILKSQKENYQSLSKDGKSTIATVTGFGRKNSVIWEYAVNGSVVEINDRKKNFKGLQRGEQFEAVYDPNNFKNTKIFLDKPVLNKVIIDTIKEVKFPYGIRSDAVYTSFRYEIDGKEYVRQRLLPSDKKWSALDSFIVLVNINNPKIAYLKRIE